MLVDCLMQVYRIGFLVTSLPVNCNYKIAKKLAPITVISPFTTIVSLTSSI